jgi:hypothetical protein
MLTIEAVEYAAWFLDRHCAKSKWMEGAMNSDHG